MKVRTNAVTVLCCLVSFSSGAATIIHAGQLLAKPEEHLRAVTQSNADLALTGVQHAKLTLEAGFTTIVDLDRAGRK